MSEKARTILNSPRTDGVTRALAWTLLATAITGLVYLVTTNPQGFITHPVIIAIALAAGTVTSVPTLARYTLEDSNTRGRLPLRESAGVLLVLAVCCLIPQHRAAIHACIALIIAAAVLILVDTARDTRPAPAHKDTPEEP